MSGLSGLGEHRRKGSHPRPEVLEAVVRRGRVRQRRSAMWTAAALAGAGSVALTTVVLDGSAQDALVELPAASQPPAVSPVQTPPVRRATASALPPRVASPGPVSLPPPGTDPPAAPLSGERDDAPSPDTAQPVRRRTTAYRERPESISVFIAADACRGRVLTDTPSGYRVCVEARSSTVEVESGGTMSVRIDVCNSISSPGPYTLSFASGREHDVQVRPGDSAHDFLWTWSRRHTFPEGAHRRGIPPGDCLRWTTSWDTRDDDGRLVPPGRYGIQPSVEVNGTTEGFGFELRVKPS